MYQPPAHIFRSYDIRGLYPQELNEEVMRAVSPALATLYREQGEQCVFVASDCRLSSPSLKEALLEGLLNQGIDVVDLGEVPSPLGYYAVATQPHSGALCMITASHNPGNFNGMKLMLAGKTLSEDNIQRLHTLACSQDAAGSSQGNISKGQLSQLDILSLYIKEVSEDFQGIQPGWKIFVDAGNSVAGPVITRLFDELGLDYHAMYCDPDGNFPNHHPDPGRLENLQDLIDAMGQDPHPRKIGLAFDGDGDRLGVIDDTLQVVKPDMLLAFLAAPLLQANPKGAIVFDIKCSNLLTDQIKAMGGRAVPERTGHSHIKRAVKENHALIGGEYSGHIFYADRWYGFDDALYSAIRLLEILPKSGSIAKAFEPYRQLFSTEEINLAVSHPFNKFDIVAALKASILADTPSNGKPSWLEGALIDDRDGLRLSGPSGWGLVRASNTSEVLVARFESATKEGLKAWIEYFDTHLKQVNPAFSLAQEAS